MRERCAPAARHFTPARYFALVLAEGLHVELKEAGVDVLALAPGFTATDLSGELDFSGTPIKPMPARPVVQAALRGLGRKAVVVPGWQNRLLVWMGKHLLPRSANTAIFGKIYETLTREAHHA